MLRVRKFLPADGTRLLPVYMISGNEIWVEDLNGKLVGTERLCEGDNAEAVARRILRAKHGQRGSFKEPIIYPRKRIV